jgi:hypothetical protein
MAEALLVRPTIAPRDSCVRFRSNCGESGSSTSSSDARSVSYGCREGALHGFRQCGIKRGLSRGKTSRIVMRSGGDKKSDSNLGSLESLMVQSVSWRQSG